MMDGFSSISSSALAASTMLALRSSDRARQVVPFLLTSTSHGNCVSQCATVARSRPCFLKSWKVKSAAGSEPGAGFFDGIAVGDAVECDGHQWVGPGKDCGLLDRDACAYASSRGWPSLYSRCMAMRRCNTVACSGGRFRAKRCGCPVAWPPDRSPDGRIAAWRTPSPAWALRGEQNHSAVSSFLWRDM